MRRWKGNRKINFFDLNKVFLQKIALALPLFILILGFQYSSAYAYYITPLNMTFESGATFSGTLTFTDDMTDLVSVTGTLLTGPSHINTGDTRDYGGTLPLTWVFYNEYSGSVKFSSKNVYADFLMSGSPSSPGDWIEIDWVGVSGSLVLDSSLSIFSDLSPGSAIYPGNTVNYFDPMVSYNTNSTEPPVTTPEPSTMLLICLGLIGLTGFRKFRK